MPKISAVDRAISQLDNEIAVLLKARDRLIAQRDEAKKPKAEKGGLLMCRFCGGSFRGRLNKNRI